MKYWVCLVSGPGGLSLRSDPAAPTMGVKDDAIAWRWPCSEDELPLCNSIEEFFALPGAIFYRSPLSDGGSHAVIKLPGGSEKKYELGPQARLEPR